VEKADNEIKKLYNMRDKILQYETDKYFPLPLETDASTTTMSLTALDQLMGGWNLPE